VLDAWFDLGDRKRPIHRPDQPFAGGVVEACHVQLEVLGDLGQNLSAPTDRDDLLIGCIR
jgi:hypothetical protein